jgi:hypothetical protein
MFSYLLGATAFHLGNATAIPVMPPANCIGGWVQQNSLAAGTLWISPGVTISLGATQGMYVNTTNQPFEFQGPARFYLYATGATITVGLGFKYSQGVSSPIAGG